MTRYQGEDIEFALNLTHLDVTEMQTWSQASRVVAYFYTDTNHIVKFSSKNESGYTKMTPSSSTQFTGCIKSEDTKVMRGAMYCDVYVKLAQGGLDKIQRVSTGIVIEPTPIKQETT